MPECRRKRCGYKLDGPNAVDREIVDEHAEADRVVSGQFFALLQQHEEQSVCCEPSSGQDGGERVHGMGHRAGEQQVPGEGNTSG